MFDTELIREALGLSKDALTVVIAVIGIYSSLSIRRSDSSTPVDKGSPKLGIEIPGIGALFWKRG